MTSNPHVRRAEMLMSQRRPELAEQELIRALSVDPNDPYAHCMLGLCQAELKKYREATESVHQAIAFAPDFPFCHYVNAHILLERNRPKEALSAIGEAIRLDPDDADHHAVQAATYLQLSRWQEALRSAEQGLAIDPENTDLLNYKSIAQVQLNQKLDADSTIDAAMRRHPENALTHANLGWAELNKGNHKEAMKSFREALRLDPENQWARQGILESMRARNPLYRLMLIYFLWMSKLSSGGQWIFIVGFYVLQRIVRAVAQQNENLAPFLWPIVWLYMAFALLTWISKPLMNLVLRFDRFGQLVLSKAEKRSSEVIACLILIIMASIAMLFVTGSFFFVIPALAAFGLIFPASTLHLCDPGWPRNVAIAFASIMLIMALFLSFSPLLVDVVLAPEKAEELAERAAPLYQGCVMLYAVMIFGGQFLFNFLTTQQVRH